MKDNLAANDRCTCMEIHGEDPRCALHGFDTNWSLENRSAYDWQQEAINLLDEAEALSQRTSQAGDAELAANIAREVMAEFLGLPVEDCSAESRGALLIREGLKRYASRLTTPSTTGNEQMLRASRAMRQLRNAWERDGADLSDLSDSHIQQFAEAALSALSSSGADTGQSEARSCCEATREACAERARRSVHWRLKGHEGRDVFADNVAKDVLRKPIRGAD